MATLVGDDDNSGGPLGATDDIQMLIHQPAPPSVETPEPSNSGTPTSDTPYLGIDMCALRDQTVSVRDEISDRIIESLPAKLIAAAREGNGTYEVLEILPDDIYLPTSAQDYAKLFGIPERVHDYCASKNLNPFVRRVARVKLPRDKYDYTYKLMVAWMPPNAPAASSESCNAHASTLPVNPVEPVQQVAANANSLLSRSHHQ